MFKYSIEELEFAIGQYFFWNSGSTNGIIDNSMTHSAIIKNVLYKHNWVAAEYVNSYAPAHYVDIKYITAIPFIDEMRQKKLFQLVASK